MTMQSLDVPLAFLYAETDTMAEADLKARLTQSVAAHDRS
jgi:hypothetical protein